MVRKKGLLRSLLSAFLFFQISPAVRVVSALSSLHLTLKNGNLIVPTKASCPNVLVALSTVEVALLSQISPNFTTGP